MDKEKELRELIKQNPKLSGNKIYEKSKAKGISIRKQDFYVLLRDIRNLDEPTKKEKAKAIPTKYKTPSPKEVKKEGTYQVAEVYDINNDTSFWIKYDSTKKFKDLFDNLKDNYGFVNYTITHHGLRVYQSFIDTEFQKELEAEGFVF